ncbi:hypothetical protein A4G19_14070 [Pasteurellaceae bacterium Macca]|nr:hypothetical protein [Pasteurellaceae bacterium Macca]
MALEIAEMATMINEDEMNKYAIQLVDDAVAIDVLDVEVSAGFGVTTDLTEVIRQVRYNPAQFYEIYSGLNPDNMKIVNIKGDSMFPTFSHGDLAFVDITITSFDGDGVYVFTYDGHTYIKRLQKAGRVLLVISDNEQYKEWKITHEELFSSTGKSKFTKARS